MGKAHKHTHTYMSKHQWTNTHSTNEQENSDFKLCIVQAGISIKNETKKFSILRLRGSGGEIKWCAVRRVEDFPRLKLFMLIMISSGFCFSEEFAFWQELLLMRPVRNCGVEILSQYQVSLFLVNLVDSIWWRLNQTGFICYVVTWKLQGKCDPNILLRSYLRKSVEISETFRV